MRIRFKGTRNFRSPTSETYTFRIHAFRGPSSLALSRGSVYIINLLMTGRPSAPVAACAAGGRRRRAGTGASVLRMADYCAPRANDTL